MSALTRAERDALSDLRDEIALGVRCAPELDGEVNQLAWRAFQAWAGRMLEGCSCGRSDGEECHCRGDPPGPD